MYYEYWNLKKPPFDNVPDPSMYVESHASVENAIAETLFAIEEGNECIAVIVGDVGLGKTMSLRMIIDSLDHEKYRIAFITNPDMSFVQLLREIVGQLIGEQCELKKKVDLLETFNRLLFQTIDEGRKVLVFIDEANAMSPANLESMRLLTNMQDDHRNLFTIVLAGQLELARRLEHPNRANLFQRIGTYNRLAKIESEELVRNYLETRLKLAGAVKPIFTDDAVSVLWEYSEHGVPRLINKLCKLGLKAGETNELDMVEGEVIRQIGERFQKLTGPAMQKRRPRQRIAGEEMIRDEIEDLQDRSNTIAATYAEVKVSPANGTIVAVTAPPPGESSFPASEKPGETKVNGLGVNVEIPSQLFEQAQSFTEEHRMKIAGVLAAQTLEKNPHLTSSHLTDPVAVWHELRDLVLHMLTPERKAV
jgi:general secretion pathway protein A